MNETTTKPAPVLLSAEQAAEIRRHAEATYPDECCGILLGREVEGSRLVERLVEIENTWDEVERRRRFLIQPKDLMRAEREGRLTGLDVLGFYHSHPDAPARPSEFDREHAWPWYSYLICGVERGKAVTLTGWQLRDDRSAYDEIAVG